MEVAVCAAIFWAGLRRAEVFALKPEDLDWRNGEINGKHEFVFSYRKPFRGSVTPGTSWIKFHFEKWLERAGIERRGRDIVPHSARHSLATFLHDKGVPLKHIQELLGHASMKVTKKYTHLLENTMKEETKIVEFKVS
jgi:integrase